MITDFSVGPFILMYHSIADNSDDPYSVSVDAFREQITWLCEYGYEVVSLAYLVPIYPDAELQDFKKKGCDNV